jgi:hypothetical protein
MDKPHILAVAAETCFCDLKSNFPLNLKIKYQHFKEKGKSLNRYNFLPLLVFTGQYF